MATKKKTTKSKAAKKTVAMQSFRVVPEQKPFVSFKITKQTVYWIVLVMVIVALQLWIIKQQIEISDLTDLLQADM